MTKKRRKRASAKMAATSAVAERVSVPSPAKTTATTNVREVSEHHHGNHRALLAKVAGAKGRPANSATVFGGLRLHDTRPTGSYLNLYLALNHLVAVNFGREKDYACWNYYSYSVGDEGAAARLLHGDNPEDVEACTKRNAMHVRLGHAVDMGKIADIGAAAALISMQVEIGEPALQPISFVGTTRTENGRNEIHARVFAPPNEGLAVVATTHLREDTTSMMAFQGSNMDAITASLSQGSMIPGDNCHPLPEFIDLSMYRAESSAEAFIGRLLAQSLHGFAIES